MDISNKKIEQLLHESACEVLDEIEVPPADKIWNKIKKELPKEKRRITLLNIKLIKYGAASIVLIMLSGIFAMPYAEAFKITILNAIVEFKDGAVNIVYKNINDSNPAIDKHIENSKIETDSVEKIINKIPFTPLTLSYIPEGFTLDKVTLENVGNDDRRLTLQYKKDNEYMVFNQEYIREAFSAGRIIDSVNSTVEETSILGQKATIIEYENGTFRVFWNTDDLRFNIFMKIDKAEVPKIINGIK